MSLECRPSVFPFPIIYHDAHLLCINASTALSDASGPSSRSQQPVLRRDDRRQGHRAVPNRKPDQTRRDRNRLGLPPSCPPYELALPPQNTRTKGGEDTCARLGGAGMSLCTALIAFAPPPPATRRRRRLSRCIARLQARSCAAPSDAGSGDHHQPQSPPPSADRTMTLYAKRRIGCVRLVRYIPSTYDAE